MNTSEPKSEYIAPVSPQKGDNIAPKSDIDNLNHTKSCSLDDEIRIAISHAIQGVQEYTSKDINAYYENRSKWVNLTTEKITALLSQAIVDARVDQIMKDFLQVSLDTTTDEATLTSIRDSQLAELKPKDDK